VGCDPGVVGVGEVEGLCYFETGVRRVLGVVPEEILDVVVRV
jgi:hypothetical protein